MNHAHPSTQTAVIASCLGLIIAPALLTDPIIATLTATPLREAVSAVLAGLIVFGVCYLAVPRVTIHGSDATDGGEN